MHIYEKDAVFRNSKDNKEFEVSVLVADIFELNKDLKAMIIIDIKESDIGDIGKLSDCDIFECFAGAMGNTFKCIFEDIYVEADYYNGSIVRLFLQVENFEHQSCKVISNNYDNMIEITNDQDVFPEFDCY